MSYYDYTKNSATLMAWLRRHKQKIEKEKEKEKESVSQKK